MLDILLHNDLFIILNKPPGIASQPDKTGDDSLLDLAEKRCHRTLHPVNRLDRPVSGIALFAKTKAVMTMLTEQFRDRSVEKVYLAVVQAEPPQESGTLVHYLQKNQVKNIVTAHVEEQPGSERAELQYRLIGKSDRYFLLEIQPVTGKHHQIRAQLSAIGCPVKGDVKYGARRGNTDRSIHLHAWKLAFEHPLSGERLSFVAPPPEDVVWKALLPSADE
jgi:23S rRNA pseudouridine1911/1915/1917 synthase